MPKNKGGGGAKGGGGGAKGGGKKSGGSGDDESGKGKQTKGGTAVKVSCSSGCDFFSTYFRFLFPMKKMCSSI